MGCGGPGGTRRGSEVGCGGGAGAGARAGLGVEGRAGGSGGSRAGAQGSGVDGDGLTGRGSWVREQRPAGCGGHGEVQGAGAVVAGCGGVGSVSRGGSCGGRGRVSPCPCPWWGRVWEGGPVRGGADRVWGGPVPSEGEEEGEDGEEGAQEDGEEGGAGVGGGVLVGARAWGEWVPSAGVPFVSGSGACTGVAGVWALGGGVWSREWQAAGCA